MVGSSSYRKRWRARVRGEQLSWLFAVVFVAVLFAGLVAFVFEGALVLPAETSVLLTICALALGFLAPPPVHRFLWHTFANRVAVEPPREVPQPLVVDGDTVDDLSNGTRYRLANVDAPETGDNAKCFLERQRGEAARLRATQLIRAASRVDVRRTFRVDKYGRRVAFILVDGRDLGKILVAAGLARHWRGTRARWCGRNGGLAKIARSGAMAHRCKKCSTWRDDD